MRREVSFTVEAEAEGQRLDTYLTQRLRALSRTQVQTLIDNDLFPKTLKSSTLIRAGLQFTIVREVAEERDPPPLSIVYEDDAVLVIDKPGDLAVHPAGRYHKYTVTSALALIRTPRPDPVHRLDRETSGLLICGRGRGPTSALKQDFADGKVEKTYRALVAGWPPVERFACEQALELGSGRVRVRMAVGRGKPATTLFEVEQRFRDADGGEFAMVRCHPKTGRQHQIRAHLAAEGFPIVGDKIYGPDETIFIRFTEDQLTDGDRAQLRFSRHALHAARVRFTHPVTGKPIALESPLPSDFEGLLAPLRSIG